MEKSLFRYFSIIAVLLLVSAVAPAQKILSVHKAEKQETVFGIAKQYGVTIDELRNANPVMREEGFVLKKGMMINIPEHIATTPQVTTVAKADAETKQKSAAKNSKHVTIGVMLPLHDINGDGRRMVEYYRGVLLAVNELKKEGVSLTVNAWNLAEGDDARTVLLDDNAGKCDVIFGPLYTAQVPALASFCEKKDIRLVIPFSINGNDVKSCKQIYQVYQTPADITAESITQFVARFNDYHPVFIDCNDATSKKGDFTFGLRKVLESKDIPYSITNLTSSHEMFAKAFSTTKRNMVVLNTGRSPELGMVFKKLEELTATMSYGISMFGYNEWLMYAKLYDQRFRRFDVYIPSVYDYNADDSRVKEIERTYSSFYNAEPMKSLPSFAVTGYDQTMFFVKGIIQYGKKFHGASSQQAYKPVQSPYNFDQVGNGGYQNHTFMLIHY